MEFLKSNLWEIKKSTVLQIFGGLLALAHLLTYLSWLRNGSAPLIYYANPTPMCWNLFENCMWVKLLSPPLMEFAFHGFGAVAVLAIGLFFFTRLVSLAWVLMALALALKTILYIQDVRLSGNIHYLLYVLNFVYLFVPNKSNLLRWMVVSYYVASGLLKLSPNWLTGQFFIDQLAVPIKLAEWLAAMAVLMEMLAPVALFFRDFKNFLIGYCCLILYHGLMWYTSGFFEPSVMLLILQIFPLLYYEEKKIEREYLYQSFIRPEPSQIWLWLGLTVFWTLQALPYIPHAELKRLKQVEHAFALAPVAASEECLQTTFVIYNDHMEEVEVAPPTDRPPAFKCNPYLRFLDIKNACLERQTDSQFKTVMSYFQVRTLKDQTYRTAFEGQDLCRDDLTYRSLLGARDGL
jgi:hypothetical protein